MATPGVEVATATTGGGAVLVPVKSFDSAKTRLSDALTAEARFKLAQAMATRLVQAQSVPVAICCDDEHVAEWATSVGAATIWCPGTDLNGAVTQGVDELRQRGYSSAVIAHSDLPLAGDLAALLHWPGITLVPDRHRQGTNVLALTTDAGFIFHYGAGSFSLHVAEASARGHAIRIVHDSRLGWDVDHPDDLDVPDVDAALLALMEGTSTE